MPKQPRSLDEARDLYPGHGFGVYCIDPEGPVYLEMYEPGADKPLTWMGLSERGCWELAFPPSELEPVAAGTFMPPEASRARDELAAAFAGDEEATVTESLFD